MKELKCQIALVKVFCIGITILIGIPKFVFSDEYHPKNDGYRAAAITGQNGQDLHKIPYADWKKLGSSTLMKRVKAKFNERKPKNVIFFIGDGMGISTQTVARLHRSQKEKRTMDESHLAWDHFPYTGIVKTYSSDKSVADSASTATAFNCGFKTRSGVVGIDEILSYGADCALLKEANKCKSVLHNAMNAGKLTGIISTARLTHATPAAAYAHTTDREWEYDGLIPSQFIDSCMDIAMQLINNTLNQDIRVLLGGGRQNFYTTAEPDVEYPTKNGLRGDINLIEEWKRIKQTAALEEPTFKYVHRNSDFIKVDPEETKYLLGLFEPSHMQYESDRKDDRDGEPSLAEMVQKSIKILEKSNTGFYLYVEGGRIDHAHHATLAQKASIDTLALSDAVQAAVDMTNEEDTLIVVSSDHSHTLTLNGYPSIDSPLYGPVIGLDGNALLANDTLPYLEVSYANGPGWADHQGSGNHRKNLSETSDKIYEAPSFRQAAMVHMVWETHGGEDVPVFASGPWSHLFRGIVEQNFLSDAINYAACFHPEHQGDHCSNGVNTQPTTSPPVPCRAAGYGDQNTHTKILFSVVLTFMPIVFCDLLNAIIV